MAEDKDKNEEYIGNIWGSKITIYALLFLVFMFALYFGAGYLGCMSPNEVQP